MSQILPAVVRNQHSIQPRNCAWALLAHTVNRLLIWNAMIRSNESMDPSPATRDHRAKRDSNHRPALVPMRLQTACLFQSANRTTVLRTLLPTDPCAPPSIVELRSSCLPPRSVTLTAPT